MVFGDEWAVRYALGDNVKSTRNDDATLGRVYGGDSGLVHVADGERANVGAVVAERTEHLIRELAANRGAEDVYDKTICPGCYMTVIYNAAVTLAKANGQSLGELGRTLSKAFADLADNKVQEVESVNVIFPNN